MMNLILKIDFHLQRAFIQISKTFFSYPNPDKVLNPVRVKKLIQSNSRE